MYDTDFFEQYTASEHGLQTNRIPIRVIRRQHSAKSPVSLHTHNFIEIFIVLSGSCHHVIHLPENDEIAYPISSGNVGIVASGEKHSFKFQSDEEINIINILFNPLVVQRGDSTNWDEMSSFDFINFYPYIPVYKRSQHQINLNENHLHDVCTLVEQIENEMKNKAIGYNTMVQHYFSIILTLLMREYYSMEETNDAEFGHSIQKAIYYINKNCKQDISLRKLSEYTHFSVRHLTRKFKKEMGVSINDYIMQLRIANAKTLLNSTSKKIEDIAMENGFSNTSYFCQQFKKITGYTPLQYRKLELNEE